MIINTPNLNQARKQIQELKKQNKEVIIKSQDPEFNRKILENKDVDVLLSPEFHNRKNKLKQRDSGLNEVLCKLAKKNNIKIAINLDEIIKQSKKQKAILLARIMQNISLCKRTKTQFIIMQKNIDKKSLFSLLLNLGMDTKTAKHSI